MAGRTGKIGVLATFAPTIASITRELEEMIAASGASVEIVTRHVRCYPLSEPLNLQFENAIVKRDILIRRHVQDAMLLLEKGDGDAHDRLIAAEATKLPGTWLSLSVLLLCVGFLY